MFDRVYRNVEQILEHYEKNINEEMNLTLW